ncbi:putative calmodulin-dependent protein kinase type 1 [Linnemannia elongata]|uniref:Putative calmodulin-dependent protein kinase type 1 n=1 Tax=Linnemannia elongata AG-77 TaxID=1314771 RepID=A0A197JG22_9FUNG|nr:hypothetical protein BGZ89_001637 [Linnemannia elongata]KAH7056775.1 putative calmodulin-dependent protein kinase type 1 [Linnemannia elongata]KAK5823084.1 putative calmodulin-dependent protein kinase type 1 [Linnemannia elongata]OAQ23364.1 putative calmodulin-dependent protein kinase type 1 [Linnemannia elongata AG-77]
MSATVSTVPCKYRTGRTLGQGTYAVVKEAVHIETGKRYAVKVINKKLMEGKEHMIRNEIAVLRRISIGHANILTLVDYFETLNNLYLVTELAEGGELFDRICRKGNYYEHDAAHLVRTICSAVAYLHEQGIVHRDLKPENLLFKTAAEDSELLIADFGLSRIMDQEKFHLLTTTCGTPGYMAPEIFQKSGHGKPVDMWALGVITYFLLCGYTPFDRQNSMDEMHAILNAEYQFAPIEYWQGVSETAKSFVNGLLTTDPSHRMTAAQALKHPWLAQSGLNQDGQTAQAPQDQDTEMEGPHDLLPSMMSRIKARTKFRNAVGAVKAINSMRKRHEELRVVHQEDVEQVLHRGDEEMV